jgi:hypothetical protein
MNLKETLLSVFSQQQNFSRVRSVEKASVKLRFRIMTEVKSEGNILNLNKYPEIKDDTLNFVLPCYNGSEEKELMNKAKIVFNNTGFQQFVIFKIKHHFNGHFLVFQIPL